MIEIQYKINDDISYMSGTLYGEISNRIPLRYMGNIDSVISIEASGDELNYIQENISGIPKSHNSKECMWFGSDAKFIVYFIQQNTI